MEIVRQAKVLSGLIKLTLTHTHLVLAEYSQVWNSLGSEPQALVPERQKATWNGVFSKTVSGKEFHPLPRSFWEAVDPPLVSRSSIASGSTNANIPPYTVVSATLFEITGKKKNEKFIISSQPENTQSSEKDHLPVANEVPPSLFAASGYLVAQVANATKNKAETSSCSDTKSGETKKSKKGFVSQLEAGIAKDSLCETLAHGPGAHRDDPETWRSISMPVKMPEATHDSEWLVQGKKRTKRGHCLSDKDRVASHGSMTNAVDSVAGVSLYKNEFSASHGTNENDTSEPEMKRIQLADFELLQAGKNEKGSKHYLKEPNRASRTNVSSIPIKDTAETFRKASSKVGSSSRIDNERKLETNEWQEVNKKRRKRNVS